MEIIPLNSLGLRFVAEQFPLAVSESGYYLGNYSVSMCQDHCGIWERQAVPSAVGFVEGERLISICSDHHAI